MTNSQFCIQQRQREQQRLNRLLIAGFVGSAALHSILAYALPKWSSNSPKQAEEPMELILVDKPKPKVEPKPKPKIESYAERLSEGVSFRNPLGKPIVEPKPKPVKPSEPVKAETSPPPVKPAEPVAAQTAPPKPEPAPKSQPAPPKPAPKPEPAPKPQPAPKKVLTNPTPAPSQPIVSIPVENTDRSSSLTSSLSSPSSSATSNSANNASTIGKPGATGSVVATGSAPPRPEVDDGGEAGISCLSNCEPEYPASLEGVEGSAGIKLTIDSGGNVVGAELVEPHSDSGINRQALLAAQQMQFSSPGNSSAAVRVNIDFTVEGSEYDRAAREAQERREQAEKERQEQEAARQQQLEAEQQARQEQLERERQARQEQLQQQQESTPPPAQTEVAEPKPLPALSPEELDEERLRKFRERIENYQ